MQKISDDLISRQAAIDFIKDHSYPVRYDGNSIEQGMTITGIEQALNELSTTQQETSTTQQESSTTQQETSTTQQETSTTQQETSTTQQESSNEIQEILDYLDNTLHPIVSPNNWYVYAELYDMVSKLQSTQPANGNS